MRRSNFVTQPSRISLHDLSRTCHGPTYMLFPLTTALVLPFCPPLPSLRMKSTFKLVQYGFSCLLALTILRSEVTAQDFSINASWSVRADGLVSNLILTSVDRILLQPILVETANSSPTLPRRLLRRRSATMEVLMVHLLTTLSKDWVLNRCRQTT